MDEATARQEERITSMKEQQDRQREFCQNCREEMIKELAIQATDIAIIKLKVIGWGMLSGLILGIIGGIVAAVIYNTITS
jgi:hypothetical protein